MVSAALLKIFEGCLHFFFSFNRPQWPDQDYFNRSTNIKWSVRCVGKQDFSEKKCKICDRSRFKQTQYSILSKKDNQIFSLSSTGGLRNYRKSIL